MQLMIKQNITLHLYLYIYIISINISKEALTFMSYYPLNTTAISPHYCPNFLFKIALICIFTSIVSP